MSLSCLLGDRWKDSVWMTRIVGEIWRLLALYCSKKGCPSRRAGRMEKVKIWIDALYLGSGCKRFLAVWLLPSLFYFSLDDFVRYLDMDVRVFSFSIFKFLSRSSQRSFSCPVAKFCSRTPQSPRPIDRKRYRSAQSCTHPLTTYFVSYINSQRI